MAIYTRYDSRLMARRYKEKGELLNIFLVIKKDSTMEVQQYPDSRIANQYLNSYYAKQNITEVVPLAPFVNEQYLPALTLELLDNYFYETFNDVIKKYLQETNRTEEGRSTLPATKSYAVPVTYQVTGVVYVTAANESDLRAKLGDPDVIKDMYLPEKTKYVKGTYAVDWESLEEAIEKKGKKSK